MSADRGTVAVASFLLLCAAAQTELYVDSLHGSDSADGSQTHPLQTISKAQSAVRSLIGKLPSQTMTVHLAEGSIFFVTEPLNFTSADSGKVNWVAAGKGATISGAVPVIAWQKSLPHAVEPHRAEITIRGIPGEIVLSGGASVIMNPILNLRSGTPNNKKTMAVVTTSLDPGAVISSVRFSYSYCLGYDPSGVGSNFTLKLGSSAVYSSPHLTGYRYNKGSDPDKVYSPPINITVNELNIAVASSGLLPLEFDFENFDRNMQLLLPMSVSISCAGSCLKPISTPTVWRATAPHRSQSRHLYINGLRANRTRSMPSPMYGLMTNVTDAGYGVQDQAFCSAAAGWPDPSTVEFVYTAVAGEWTESRLTLLSVDIGQGNSSCLLNMAQPAFFNFRHKQAQSLGNGQPTYIENDGVAPLAVGDFYLDRRTNTVLLGAGAAPPTDVMMPVAEKLLHARGVEGITFKGINFTQATWLQPSGGDGYIEQQSGFIHVGTNNTSVKTPANVHLEQCTSVTFDACSFTHLGGVGLDISGGSHNCLVDGCLFEDVSAAGVQIGSFDTALETDPAHQDLGNTVRDSVLRSCAVEYRGNVGLIVGYTAGTVIDHNTITNLTYGGISLGWGWTTYTGTYAHNNTISGNDIGYYKSLLRDGGGVYTLGPQNLSRVFGNYVHDQLDGGATGALYPDQGSAYMHWYGNVVERTHGATWLHIWTGNIHDINVTGNFADTNRARDQGHNCPVLNTTVYTPGEQTAAAKTVIRAAGAPISKSSRWQ